MKGKAEGKDFGIGNFCSINQKLKQIKSQNAGKILKHLVYDSLLSGLQNTQIRVVETGQILPYILHEKTISEFSLSEIVELKKSLIRHAINSPKYEVIYDVPWSLSNELKKENKADCIFENRIVVLPTSLRNALICAELKKQFSREQILSCEGFIEVCEENEQGESESEIRLDIDDWIVRNGFMIPVLSSGGNGLIDGLRVFRHPQDRKSFILRSRNKYYGGKKND